MRTFSANVQPGGRGVGRGRGRGLSGGGVETHTMKVTRQYRV